MKLLAEMCDDPAPKATNHSKLVENGYFLFFLYGKPRIFEYCGPQYRRSESCLLNVGIF